MTQKIWKILPYLTAEKIRAEFSKFSGSLLFDFKILYLGKGDVLHKLLRLLTSILFWVEMFLDLFYIFHYSHNLYRPGSLDETLKVHF